MKDSMRKFVFLIIFALGVKAESYDFGHCRPLAEPIATHPRFGYVVKAGELSVYKDGDDIVARAHCDSDQGFILLSHDSVQKEMRCSYQEERGNWVWNHHHRDKISPPAIRCAHVSPRPALHKFKLGPEFTGCSEPGSRAETLIIIQEKLSTSMPCLLAEKCVVSNLTCEVSENCTTLSLMVISNVLQHVMEQKLISEAATHYLRSYPFKQILGQSSYGRVKRLSLDAGLFDNAEFETDTDTGCPDGEVQDGLNCQSCPAGTYADKISDPQECKQCDYDTYSLGGTNSCTACPSGKGTLETRSGSADDCIEVCDVPAIEFVASKDPEYRVAEGGTVSVICQSGYTYGGNSAAEIVCSSTANNFPASCRKVSISASLTSIREGDSAVISCIVEASDNGNTIQWFKGDSITALISDDTAYTIATTMASSKEADGKTMKSTSTLSIPNFASDDAASYSCKVYYTDPILNDASSEQALFLGWNSITRDTAVEFNLDSNELEVLTSKSVGSAGLLSMESLSSSDTPLGGFEVNFSTMNFKVMHCDTEYFPFNSTVTSTTDLNVWRFKSTLWGASGIIIKIWFNDVEVASRWLRCTVGDWIDQGMPRITAKIKFSTDDTVSSKYKVHSTAASLICSGKEMVFIRGGVTDCDSSQTLYFQDPASSSCKYAYNTKLMTIGIHECKTAVEYDSMHVKYKNTLKCGWPDGVTGHVQRHHETGTNVQCSYLRTEDLSDPAWSVSGVTAVELKEKGSLIFALEVYDSAFDTAKTSSDYPLTLSLNTDVYMQLSVDTTDTAMSLHIVDVFAATQASLTGYNGVKYYLWRDGCVEGETASIVEQGDVAKKRFKFSSFKFTSTERSVYIHAKVRVCGTDKSSCTFTCTGGIRRRQDDLETLTEGKDYEISLGPFITVDPDAASQFDELNSGVCEKAPLNLLLLAMTPLSFVLIN